VTHNHPSGQPAASETDIQLTIDLLGTLRSIDVKLVDHVIVAGGQALSFAACQVPPFNPDVPAEPLVRRRKRQAAGAKADTRA
jgi:hypothetical protein